MPLTMGLVDHGHGHVAHHLVVVYPRVEQGIDQGDDDEEDEHALVLDDAPHLAIPDVARVLYVFLDAREYRHR